MRLIFGCLLTLSLLAGGFCLTAGNALADDLKDQVHKLLKENPEWVLEIIKEHRIVVLEQVQKASQEKRKLAAKKRLEAEIKNPFKPVLDPDRNYQGKADAPFTIVVYSDFLCTYCNRGHKTVKELSKKRPGQIRILMKHAPRSDFSRKLALYYEAAIRQDPKKAEEFAGKVFKNQRALNKDGEKELKKLVAELKLDQKQLEKDLADPKLKELVEADGKEHGKFGFTGTPTFLINGVSLRGAYPLSEFEKIMERLEKEKK